MSTARKSKYKRKEEKDRKNHKLWAEGARESILTPHIEPYADALARGWVAEQDYLACVCNEYHALIPWSLPDDEEPDTPLPTYDPTSPAVVENLTAEDEQARAVHIKDKIKLFSVGLAPVMAPEHNPYLRLLLQLSSIKSPPKAHQAYQQYMHTSYELVIKPEVERQWQEKIDKGEVNETTKQPPSFRAKVAKSMFDSLDQSSRDAIKQAALDERAANVLAYEKTLKEPHPKAPADRQKCIDNLGNFFGPILDGVQALTGLHLVVFAGGPMPKHRRELGTVYINAGMNRERVPRYWGQWGGEKFKTEVIQYFKDYFETCFTREEREVSALLSLLDNRSLICIDEPGSPDLATLDTTSSSDSDSDMPDDIGSESDSILDGSNKRKKKAPVKTSNKRRKIVTTQHDAHILTAPPTATRSLLTLPPTAPPSGPTSTPSVREDVSEPALDWSIDSYAEEHARNIERNKEMMRSMDLASAVSQITKGNTSTSTPVKKPSQPHASLKRASEKSPKPNHRSTRLHNPIADGPVAEENGSERAEEDGYSGDVEKDTSEEVLLSVGDQDTGRSGDANPHEHHNDSHPANLSSPPSDIAPGTGEHPHPLPGDPSPDIEIPDAPSPVADVPGVLPANTDIPDRNTWPKWPTSGYEDISKIDLGESYTHLLNLLVKLEAANNFKNMTCGLPKTGRPAQLDRWIANGRGHDNKAPRAPSVNPPVLNGQLMLTIFHWIRASRWSADGHGVRVRNGLADCRCCSGGMRVGCSLVNPPADNKCSSASIYIS
ncbi:hypothetical protein BJ138DRAFT_1106539, partial [Hygrophoropsis aurantiaca]